MSKAFFRLICVVVLLWGACGAEAQYDPFSHHSNPFSVVFTLAWHVPLPDYTKLIEPYPVRQARQDDLVLLVGGQNNSDFRRQLLLTHWDGFRFVTDASASFLGWAVDPLLAGHFADITPTQTPPLEKSAPDFMRKGARVLQTPPAQIVAAGGIYLWKGGGFERLADAPAGLRFSLVLPNQLDLLASGYGDNTTLWTLQGGKLAISNFQLNPADAGYPHWAIGTYPYEGRQDFLPNILFAQVYWKDQQRWLIGVIRSVSDVDSNSTKNGERLVVYVPKEANKDLTFWKLIHADDYEESWHSAPLPGSVLDVRIGDPRNEGKVGLLALIDEGEGKRELYCFQPSK